MQVEPPLAVMLQAECYLKIVYTAMGLWSYPVIDLQTRIKYYE